MADVRTEGLNTADVSTLVSTLSPTHTKNMTVEKPVGQTNQVVSKGRTNPTDSSSGGPSTVPTSHLKVSSSNSQPMLPKKTEPKYSPSRVPGGTGTQPQSQQVPKSKGNPWHKPPNSGAQAKNQQQILSPEARTGTTPAIFPQVRENMASSNISIPQDQVKNNF